ncbi:MAG: hypothetical protein LR008_03075 [Candidatus Pacebacteria bacterium]|nr:hypothetical protein [Candidatus Paceibacterota bacterium]
MLKRKLLINSIFTMHPELIEAVKERQELGYSQDKIRDELRAAGHGDDVIRQVLQLGTTEKGKVHVSLTSDLLASGFDFIKNRTDLLMALVAPAALITVMGYIVELLPLEQQASAEIIVGLISLFLLIFYVLILVAVLYIVTQNNKREVSIREGLAWSKKNIWSILWIYILMITVIWGGLVVFIIPGIILWLAVHFAQYVYVHEGLKGVLALRRSRDMVKGNWLALAKPLSLVGIFMLIIFLILGGVAGLVEGLSGGNGFSEMISILILDVFSAGATIIGLAVGAQLYQDISLGQTEAASSENIVGGWKYVVISIFGLVTIVVAGFSVSALEGDKMELFEESPKTSLDAKTRAAELRVQNDSDTQPNPEE